MTTRRFSTTRLASLTVLTIALGIGSQAFVPSAFGCGTMNGSDCRTSTNGGGSGKSASGVMSFLAQLRTIIDIGGALIP